MCVNYEIGEEKRRTEQRQKNEIVKWLSVACDLLSSIDRCTHKLSVENWEDLFCMFSLALSNGSVNSSRLLPVLLLLLIKNIISIDHRKWKRMKLIHESENQTKLARNSNLSEITYMLDGILRRWLRKGNGNFQPFRVMCCIINFNITTHICTYLHWCQCRCTQSNRVSQLECVSKTNGQKLSASDDCMCAIWFTAGHRMRHIM